MGQSGFDARPVVGKCLGDIKFRLGIQRVIERVAI